MVTVDHDIVDAIRITGNKVAPKRHIETVVCSLSSFDPCDGGRFWLKQTINQVFSTW